jgi:prevent-host-death family protein
MRTMTATEASRGFSDLLDAVERGETIRITRGGETIAEVTPARRKTGRDLDAALGPSRLDEDFEKDIAKGLSILTRPNMPWLDS